MKPAQTSKKGVAMGRMVLPPEAMSQLALRAGPQSSRVHSASKVKRQVKQVELDQIDRLLQTETSYVTSLITFRDVYAFPVLSNQMLSELLSENPSVAVFLTSVDQLATIHRKFLPELERWYKTWKSNPLDGNGIGRVFLGFIGFFIIYANYYKNYWRAIPVLERIPSTSFNTSSFLADGAPPKLGVLSLMPVKQLLRYQLFIKGMMEAVPANTSDWKDLEKSLDGISKLSTNIKEMLDAGKPESRLKQSDQSKKAHYTSDIAAFAPGRAILKEGIVRLLRSFHMERRLVLFEETLLVVKMTVLGYELEYIFRISEDSIISDSKDDESRKLHSFCFSEIVDSKDMVEFCAPSPQAKREWMREIGKEIDLARSEHNLEPKYSRKEHKKDTKPPERIAVDSVDKCMRGFEPFSIFRRKYHCSCCGYVVCEGCRFQTRKLDFTPYNGKPGKVCTDCAKRIDQGKKTPWRDEEDEEDDDIDGADRRQDFSVRGLDGVDETVKQVITEIVVTERSYVRNLTTLMEVFVLPLQSRSNSLDSSQRIKLSSRIAVFLSSIGHMYTLNCELLADLENSFYERQLTLKKGRTVGSIESTTGQIFIKFGPLFRLYGQYAKYHQDAVIEFKQKSHLKTFIDERRESEKERVGANTLESYMIMPIQRIPRYELLLKSLLKNISNSEDEKQVQLALKSISTCMEHLDELISEHQGLENIQELEKRFVFKTPVKLLKPHQRLLMEGSLQSTEGQGGVKLFKFHLFVDCLIQSSENFFNLNVVQIFSLDFMVLELFPDSEKYSNCFILKTPEGSLFVSAKDPTEKQTWMEKLKYAISGALEKLNQLHSSATIERKQIQETQDEVETFLHSIKLAKKVQADPDSSQSLDHSKVSFAPVWLPDDLQGECLGCAQKFGIFRCKHHCRNCGRLLCDDCTRNRGFVPKVSKTSLSRVCDPCHRKRPPPPAELAEDQPLNANIGETDDVDSDDDEEENISNFKIIKSNPREPSLFLDHAPKETLSLISESPLTSPPELSPNLNSASPLRPSLPPKLDGVLVMPAKFTRDSLRIIDPPASLKVETKQKAGPVPLEKLLERNAKKGGLRDEGNRVPRMKLKRSNSAKPDKVKVPKPPPGPPPAHLFENIQGLNGSSSTDLEFSRPQGGLSMLSNEKSDRSFGKLSELYSELENIIKEDASFEEAKIATVPIE